MLKINQAVIEQRVADEIILYHPKSGNTASLDPITAQVWSECKEKSTIQGVVRAVGIAQGCSCLEAQRIVERATEILEKGEFLEKSPSKPKSLIFLGQN